MSLEEEKQPAISMRAPSILARWRLSRWLNSFRSSATERWEAAFRNKSAAVVLCRADNLPLRAVFAEADDPLLVQQIQKSVLNGEREPEY